MQLTWTYDALVKLLEAAAAAGPPAGALNGAKVKLFKNDVTPTPLTLIADLTEADFVGYAAKTITTWDGAWVGIDGMAHMRGGCVQFQPTDDTSPNTVYGYWVEAATPGTYPIVAVRFDTPRPLATAFDSLYVDPEVAFPANLTVVQM